MEICLGVSGMKHYCDGMTLLYFQNVVDNEAFGAIEPSVGIITIT